MAICNNCGHDTGDDMFCGACGQRKSDSTSSTPNMSSQLPPPNDRTKFPPPPSPQAAIDNRNMRRLESAGKTAAGCGIGVLIGFIIVAVVVTIVFISLLNELSKMNSGMGAHVVAASSYVSARLSTVGQATRSLDNPLISR